MKTFYHGTTVEAATKIMAGGFDIDAPRKDHGDFGRGIYLTTSLSRAKAYGSVVLEVEVYTADMAMIPNPYFVEKMRELEPKTDAEKLFYEHAFGTDKGGRTIMLTIHGKNPAGVSSLIRHQFMSREYTGILTRYHGDETVVFDTNVIKSITWKRSAYSDDESGMWDSSQMVIGNV